MKQSWIVGILVIYIALQYFTMNIQISTTGDANVWHAFDSMFHYNLTNNTLISALSSVIMPAGVCFAILMTFGQAILLYFPALWTGNWVWFYWIICLPVAIGFVISILTIIRGVHTS